GAMPVMEGKAMIFRQFAGVNAYPIILATQDTEAIIQTVKNIAPAFGGINLEDISAPRCFEIERRLIEMLDIPVMHDDQYGTAIVVLAGLVNALKVVKKKMQNIKIVILGAGAAGTAIAKTLISAGAKDVVVLDSKGVIAKKRPGLHGYKKELAGIVNPRSITGELKDAMRVADVFIGVSGPNLVNAEHIKLMGEKPIVFALANPTPEIMPEEARRGGAYIIATGRSDFPNQINNALAFPGIFRGALDNNIKKITDEMKRRAAYAIAGIVKHPNPQNIIPSIFNKKLVGAVARAMR
ncbi:MAG: NADP-dependent malic enzyme, partial [Candidatus Liptonbacteria bacterium]|nr:NADP-dependent malic enzyme [Candidatus Liptonbacteria bacterium]